MSEKKIVLTESLIRELLDEQLHFFLHEESEDFRHEDWLNNKLRELTCMYGEGCGKPLGIFNNQKKEC
jgi:hypothetical protein